MNRQQFHACYRHLHGGAFDGLGNVVELEVEEDVFTLVDQLSYERHAFSCVEFHADLVKADTLSTSFDDGTRFGGGGHIERDDDRIAHMS